MEKDTQDFVFDFHDGKWKSNMSFSLYFALTLTWFFEHTWYSSFSIFHHESQTQNLVYLFPYLIIFKDFWCFGKVRLTPSKQTQRDVKRELFKFLKTLMKSKILIIFTKMVDITHHQFRVWLHKNPNFHENYEKYTSRIVVESILPLIKLLLTKYEVQGT